MPMLFTPIDEGVCILRIRGVFKQVKVYCRKGDIYAGHGSGFVRLYKHLRGTSNTNITYEDIHLPFPITFDGNGKMIYPNPRSAA